MTVPIPIPVRTSDAWWFTERTGWADLEAVVYAAWAKREGARDRLTRDDALIALAFGYSGHVFYGDRAWKDAVGSLERDWRESGLTLSRPWSDPRSAVKAGWIAFEPASADPLEAALAPTVESSYTAMPPVGHAPSVPGGRPDHPLELERSDAHRSSPPPAEPRVEEQRPVPGGRMDGHGHP